MACYERSDYQSALNPEGSPGCCGCCLCPCLHVIQLSVFSTQLEWWSPRLGERCHQSTGYVATGCPWTASYAAIWRLNAPGKNSGPWSALTRLHLGSQQRGLAAFLTWNSAPALLWRIWPGWLIWASSNHLPGRWHCWKVYYLRQVACWSER